MSVFENISQNKTTNLFETNSGAINIAPVKISGCYKLVVVSTGDDDIYDTVFYLDDYTGRRQKIDKNQQFLPQVSNFLKTKTIPTNNDNLRYGAFQRNTKKYYHAPLYINGNLPNFFVISRVIDDNISDPKVLQKYGDIIKIFDLNKIGLVNIFNEIESKKNFDYPLYFNFEDSYVNLFGYDINNGVETNIKLNLQNFQSNQPYLDVLNNKIVNSFDINGLIYPRFLNVEFEFEYVNNYKPFNNFYGFYGIGKEVTKNLFDENKFNIVLSAHNTNIEWTQTKDKNIELQSFNDLVSTVSIMDIANQLPQIRFHIHKVSVGDKIEIIHPNGNVYYTYFVTRQDIFADSLNQTLIHICANATKKSGRNFIFTSDHNNIITVRSNIVDILIEDYSIRIPSYFKILDRYADTDYNYFKFRAITNSDINLCVQSKLNVVDVKIKNISYTIIDKFQYNGYDIIRLNSDIDINGITFIEIFETKQQQLIEINNITWLDTNSSLLSIEQYDQKGYCNELRKLFGGTTGEVLSELNQLSISTVNDFEKELVQTHLPYINDDGSECEETGILFQENNNTETIKTLLFNSAGSTAYLTPNILNISKEFYFKNGNIDFNLMNNDSDRYNWFLIHGKCPEYCKTDIRSTRYFTDKPKITSRLISINDDFCETIFLGVKYQLPKRYSDYQFAVYLEFENTLDIEISYVFDVDNINNTVYLKVCKYLDFVDLIRGGNILNKPLVDLSFFYAVQKSYNTKSEFLYGFKSGGILFCDSTQEVLFETTLTTDWKIENNGVWFVCLKRSTDIYTPPFTSLFPESGNIDFYVYSTINYNGKEYTYISMAITVTNIKNVTTDFLWCSDVKIKFFDTKEIFVQKYGNNLTEEILYVKKSNIINIDNESLEIFGDYVKKASVVVDGNLEKFKLLLPEKIMSLKENYFELSKEIITNDNGTETVINKFFKFPEFFKPDYSIDNMVNIFAKDSWDNTSTLTKITLFDRNQIWRMIKDIIQIDVKFKFVTKEQVRSLVEELVIPNLKEYSDFFNIRIQNTEPTTTPEFIKLNIVENDYNLVIWNLLDSNNVYKISRYKAPYFPYMIMLNNEFEFQLPQFKRNNSIYTIFDNDFGGTGISATSLWNEVSGNIVSSLFCKHDDIEIMIDFQEKFDYKKLLIEKITVDECIIHHNNYEYISKFNNNIDEYIIETYVNWLLLNFYKFAKLENELGQSLKFQLDDKIKTIIMLPKLVSYDANFSKLKLIFNRK